MVWTEKGLLESEEVPGADPNQIASASSVCPFSSDALNEDQIGKQLFHQLCQYDSRTGYYGDIYAGRVSNDDTFANSSSGGLGRWILSELLNQGMVDFVIHVAKHYRSDSRAPLYSFTISTSVAEVMETAQSAYYPVEMSGVLAQLRKIPGRYAITGLPCFIKAVRLLSNHDPIFRERIRYCVGLVCGHLKSRRYAEMIGWQLGVPPTALARLDFRCKLPGKRANEKGVAAYGNDDPETPKGIDIVQNLFGTKYAWGFFQPNACNYCDDVFAETADIVIGDAWLPKFIDQGTSLLITRNPELGEMIKRGIDRGELLLHALTAQEAADSQDAGLRHRREGLRYRLKLAEDEGRWHPPKRVTAGDSHLTNRYKNIFRLRMALAEKSHHAFEQAVKANDFVLFRKLMAPLVDKYLQLYSNLRFRRFVISITKQLGIFSFMRIYWRHLKSLIRRA